MKSLFYKWIKNNTVIIINAGSIIGTTIVTSGFGFVFWWLAARRFPLEAVGIASASISTMSLLGTLCMLGLGTLLITELPRQPNQHGSLISTALVVVGVAGGGVGIIFAILASYISSAFLPLRANIGNMLIFSIGVSLTAITLVLDQAVVGLLSGTLQLWRNSLFAIAKLVALSLASIWLSNVTGMTIYTTWALGNAFSLVALAVIALWKGTWSGRVHLPQWRLLRKLGATALLHHLLNLGIQASGLILPLIVTVMLSATMNALFYVSSMLASFVSMIPVALTMVLHAMNSAQQTTLGQKARVTIGLALVTCTLANCVLLFATKQVLGIFGTSYADQAAWSLRILALQAFPIIIKTHYISICRIYDKITQAMLSMLPGGLLELVAAAIGAHFGGLSGLCLGQTLALFIESIFMFPTIYKTIRLVNTNPSDFKRQKDREGKPAWLMDTISLASKLSENKEEKPVWLMDTSILISIMQTYKMRAVRLKDYAFEEVSKKKTWEIDAAIDKNCQRRNETNKSSSERTHLRAIRLQRYESDGDHANEIWGSEISQPRIFPEKER